jgi:hypothetical protein
MPSYYDDNFGWWEDMDDPENVEHYIRTQRTNVLKKCRGCDQLVRIQPNYAYCNSCANKIERGMDIG